MAVVKKQKISSPLTPNKVYPAFPSTMTRESITPTVSTVSITRCNKGTTWRTEATVVKQIPPPPRLPTNMIHNPNAALRHRVLTLNA